MERILIIFEVDVEYVKDVLTFLTLEHLRKGKDFTFCGLKWEGKEKFGEKVFEIGKDFHVTEERTKAPLAFTNALILSLSQQKEISLHQEISSFLETKGISQLNPFSTSIKADDKHYSISKLKQRGFPTPNSLLITDDWNKRKIISEIEEFLEKNRAFHFYIQPNFGTEGRETYFFSKEEFKKEKDFIVEIVRHILQSQPVIVKGKRGNVYFYRKEEAEKGYRQVVFRIIVYQITKKIEANYGFAELSKDGESFISSLEKGGRITGIIDTFSSLYYQEEENFKKLLLTKEEISFIESEAVRAYKFFNSNFKEKLRFCGIDFLLEFEKGKLSPVFLEINPRPSGLNRVEKFPV
ncbi:hypothetical protein J7K19_08995 [bacterium]|nr:hypothetical protein [bacterium]